jgi:polysaccharide export outer membrane protein
MKTILKKIVLLCLVMFLSQVAGLFTAENVFAVSQLSKATQIMDIQLEQKDTLLKVIIKGNGLMFPKVFPLSNRIVIDIPDVNFNTKVPVKVVPPVKDIRAGKHKDMTRIVLDMEERKKFNVSLHEDTIIIAIESIDPPIIVGQKMTKQVEQKPEIIEKKDIKPLKTETSVASSTLRESQKPETIVGEASTEKKISTEISGKDYVIGPEDVLDIQVWGNDDLKRTVEVSQEGSFTFPLIDKVYAAGRTVFELEQLLKKRLGEGFLREPQVTVTVSKYKNQKVVVFGEVKKPGSYVITGKTHILEILSSAEGLTDRAGSIITIVRPQVSLNKNNSTASGEAKESKIIEVNLDSIAEGTSDESFFVISGDSVYVSKASPIFVTGEVNKPGEYKWEKGLTIHQAVSLAGGPTKRGALNRLKIVRTENGKEKTVKPSLSDMVMPYDIIKVPESYF